jgi:hypothetical protein
MKQLIISILLLVGSFVPTMAQVPILVFDPKIQKDFIPIKGGEEGKSYAAIIKTALGKKELVDKTTAFLAKYEIVDLKDLHLDEITEEQSEYTMPISLRYSFSGVSGMMGSKVVFSPVKLHSNLRFEFHDNGNVMIVLDNMKEISFFLTDPGTRCFEYYPNDLASPIADYRGHYSAAMMENSVLLKVLIVANKGLDGLAEYKSKVDDYFTEVSSKYKVLSQVEADGKGEWLTDRDIIGYGENTKNNTGLNFLKLYYDEGRLLNINKKRWEGKIRPVIDMLFKTISANLSGTIDGVAEDGERIWIDIDGSVVPVDPKWTNNEPPTDPKEREKYVKKNQKKQY